MGVGHVTIICLTPEQFERSAHGRNPDCKADLLLAAEHRDGRLCWSIETLNRIRLKHSPFGVGDVVAAAVKPLAKLMGLENCAGCMGRQADLNEWLPLVKLK